ncbi:MAG: hypothetical protein SAK29_00485 [Scytonema sp. PMC 1069.18]|nr:hypothetical protein [Scytonema sp. PMC 1069.18]MEC4882594.1 hypothetical protein [Scytonema sp. PMC 1070.18]
MATDNQRLVSSLPSDLYERFKQFCDEQQMKSSEALQKILTEYFSMLPTTVSENGTNRETRLASIEKKLEILDSLTQRISALENSFAEMHEQIHVHPSVEVEETPLEEEESVPELHPETNGVSNGTHSQSPTVEVSGPRYTIAELAERLGVNKTTVSRNKNKDNFEEWSSGRDPEGISWEYREEEQLFYPLNS